MMTIREPQKMTDKKDEQAIIDAVKSRINHERNRKLRRIVSLAVIGLLTIAMTVLGEYTAAAVFYLDLIIYEERGRP